MKALRRLALSLAALGLAAGAVTGVSGTTVASGTGHHPVVVHPADTGWD